MANISIDITVKKMFDRAKLIEEIKGALSVFADEVMSASYDVVPIARVRGGTLSRSGFVEPPEEQGGQITIRFGYGGDASGYALYVHEDLAGDHPVNPNWSWAKAEAAGKEIQWSRPGSGPKFLENPFKERQHLLPGRIRDAAVRAFKK